MRSEQEVQSRLDMIVKSMSADTDTNISIQNKLVAIRELEWVLGLRGK